MSVTKMKEFSDAVLDVCKSYYADVDDLRDRLAAENAELRAGAIAANWHWCTDGNAIINYYGTTIALVSSKEQAERIVRQHQLACNYYRLRIRELDPSADGLHDWQLEKFNQFVVSAAKFEEIKSENAELQKRLDWAQQIVKAQEATSNGAACAEERAAGNGGCGACAWCCSTANATLDEERAAYATLLESHEIILDALTESDATLDALREAVPENKPEKFCADCQEVTYFSDDNYCKCCGRYQWEYERSVLLQSILYPQPPETTDVHDG